MVEPFFPRPPEDRTFKGYELYADEVRRQREAEKARLRKYKDREVVTAALLVAALLTMAAGAAAWFTACRP